jgi:hypothetical protein
MSFKIPVKYTVLIVIGLILALFASGYILGRKHCKSTLQPTIDALQTEITRITVKLNNNILYVTSVEQELATVKEAKDKGDLTNKELHALNIKQVNELTRLRLQMDTLLSDVSHNGVIVVHDTIGGGSTNALELPFSFHKTDKWMKLDGNFDDKGVLGVHIGMSADVDLWTGLDSKTKLPIAKLTTTNPYLKTINISSIKLDTPKDKKFNVSIAFGYGVCKTGLSPILGITIGRTIFKF